MACTMLLFSASRSSNVLSSEILPMSDLCKATTGWFEGEIAPVVGTMTAL